MSDEPFRMPRSAHRDPEEKPAETHRPTEESKTVREETKPVNRNRSSESNSRKTLMVVAAAVVAVLLAVAGWWAWTNMSSDSGIDSGKYQAVFFTNGQVYFGKLHTFSGESMKLNNIFYIQASQTSANPQKTSEAQTNNLQLIKLGSEIHGPQDEMILAKNQVLFYENLKSDSKVSQLIDEYNKSHK
jgi:hypothetical protein